MKILYLPISFKVEKLRHSIRRTLSISQYRANAGDCKRHLNGGERMLITFYFFFGFVYSKRLAVGSRQPFTSGSARNTYRTRRIRNGE